MEKRLIVQVTHFAQNLDMLHFRSKQPGDMYYFLPLSIYLFRIVSPFISSSSPLAQYFTEDEEAKGDNNVSSLLRNNFKLCGFMEKENDKGLFGEYVVVMENYGGQNKNQVVIRFLLMMTDIGIFQNVSNVYLVHRQTKNACDWCFYVAKAILSPQKYLCVLCLNYTTI